MAIQRIISLFITFVMLFNLSSQTFAGVIKASSLGKIFEKEREEINTSLNTLYKKQTQNTKNLSLQRRYEQALENYVKAGQDYEDFVYSLDILISFREELQRQQEETNYKENELFDTLEKYNQDVKRLNAEVATLETQQEDYIAWKILEPIMSARKKEEILLLKELEQSENQKLKRKTKKAREELYENLKEEITSTEDFFKLEKYWKEYEERWANAGNEEDRLLNQYNQNNIVYKNLKDFQKIITKQLEKNDETYNKKIDELFGMDNTELKVSDQTDFDVFISMAQKKVYDMYENYLAKKAIYEKLENQYLVYTLNIFENKVKRFNGRIEKLCEEVEEQYDNYAKSGKNDRSLINMYEKMTLNACIAPVITPGDFDGTNETTDLTFADFIEMKYNEYKETYNMGDSHIYDEETGVVGCNIKQNWVQTEEEDLGNWKKRIWCKWKPDIKAIAENKAKNVLGLLLISPTVGTQALVALESEWLQAVNLNTKREAV